MDLYPNILQKQKSFAYVTVEWGLNSLNQWRGDCDFDVLHENLGTYLFTKSSSVQKRKQFEINANCMCHKFPGSVPNSNYLESDQYIPQRIKDKFNKKTSFIMENGLEEFFSSFSAFSENLQNNISPLDEDGDRDYNDDDDADEIQALTVDNLRGPVILVLCLSAFSCFIFLIEILVFELKKRRIIGNFTFYP